MIVKMKFLSISGPRTDIDRVCDVYLSKYEMQLETRSQNLRRQIICCLLWKSILTRSPWPSRTVCSPSASKRCSGGFHDDPGRDDCHDPGDQP